MDDAERRRRRSARLAQQLVLEWTTICSIAPPFGDVKRAVSDLAAWLSAGTTPLTAAEMRGEHLYPDLVTNGR